MGDEGETDDVDSVFVFVFGPDDGDGVYEERFLRGFFRCCC